MPTSLNNQYLDILANTIGCWRIIDSKGKGIQDRLEKIEIEKRKISVCKRKFSGLNFVLCAIGLSIIALIPMLLISFLANMMLIWVAPVLGILATMYINKRNKDKNLPAVEKETNKTITIYSKEVDELKSDIKDMYIQMFPEMFRLLNEREEKDETNAAFSSKLLREECYNLQALNYIYEYVRTTKGEPIDALNRYNSLVNTSTDDEEKQKIINEMKMGQAEGLLRMGLIKHCLAFKKFNNTDTENNPAGK